MRNRRRRGRRGRGVRMSGPRGRRAGRRAAHDRAGGSAAVHGSQPVTRPRGGPADSTPHPSSVSQLARRRGQDSRRPCPSRRCSRRQARRAIASSFSPQRLKSLRSIRPIVHVPPVLRHRRCRSRLGRVCPTTTEDRMYHRVQVILLCRQSVWQLLTIPVPGVMAYVSDRRSTQRRWLCGASAG
jgi:hypothetical protein